MNIFKYSSRTATQHYPDRHDAAAAPPSLLRFGVCLNFYRGLERRAAGSGGQAASKRDSWGSKRDSWTLGTDRSTDSAFCR